MEKSEERAHSATKNKEDRRPGPNPVQKDQAQAKNEWSRRALGFTEKNMIF
jgi:hypothetical protein